MQAANKCLLFAGFALLCNWDYTIKYNREIGLTSEAIQPIGLLVLGALIALPFIVVRTWRLLRDSLDRGMIIPKKLKLVDWNPCLMLLPLLFHVGHESVGIASDGTFFTSSFSYGSDAGLPAFIVLSLLIILYQLHASLKLAAGEDGLPAGRNVLGKYSWER